MENISRKNERLEALRSVTNNLDISRLDIQEIRILILLLGLSVVLPACLVTTDPLDDDDDSSGQADDDDYSAPDDDDIYVPDDDDTEPSETCTLTVAQVDGRGEIDGMAVIDADTGEAEDMFTELPFAIEGLTADGSQAAYVHFFVEDPNAVPIATSATLICTGGAGGEITFGIYHGASNGAFDDITIGADWVTYSSGFYEEAESLVGNGEPVDIYGQVLSATDQVLLFTLDE
jgi:hypothetical protein